MFEQNLAELIEDITEFEALLITNEEEREKLWRRYCELDELQYEAIKREEACAG